MIVTIVLESSHDFQPLFTMYGQHTLFCGFSGSTFKPSGWASDQPQTRTIRPKLVLIFSGIWTNLNMILWSGLGCASSPPQTTPPTHSAASWYRLSTFSNNGEALWVHRSASCKTVSCLRWSNRFWRRKGASADSNCRPELNFPQHYNFPYTWSDLHMFLHCLQRRFHVRPKCTYVSCVY